MKRIIAIDGNACHYFMVDLSDARYHRPKYMEALYNSLEMVFKKLKYHKGKMDITINVIEGGPDEKTKGQKQKRAKGFTETGAKPERSTLGETLGPGPNLGTGEAILPPDEDAHRAWYQGIQKEIQRRERQNRFLQDGNVEDVRKPEGGGVDD